MRSHFQTNKNHMLALKRRVNFLRARIAASSYPGSLAFDRAEASALDWAIRQIAQEQPELYRAVFDPPSPPTIQKMADQLQKRFAAGGGR